MVTPESLAVPQPEQIQQPFKVFILKMVRDCNLNCKYCYMYNLADQSYKLQPPFMSTEVIQATAQRIGEHATEHDLDNVLVALHGGEPLLADTRDTTYYEQATNEFKQRIYAARGENTEVFFGMQVNGTLLNRENLDRFRRLGIRVGVSIDGAIDAHDKNRRYRNGNYSFREAAAGLRLLMEEYPDIQATTLCVIDPNSEPRRVYENLAAYGAKSIEFILPLATLSSPPERPPHLPTATPYADWLIQVLNEWWRDGPERPSIPLFEEITRLIAGEQPSLEYIGGTSSDNIVVETNGDIEDTDTLKVTAPGMTKLGLNVLDNSFTEALHHPKVRRRQMGRSALAAACLECDVVDVCGGGYYVHRYKAGSNNGDEFRNPSVYCDDLYKLIAAVADKMIDQADRRTFNRDMLEFIIGASSGR